MKAIAARYGIKVWAVFWCKDVIFYNLKVYTGKIPWNTLVKILSHRVLCDLMELSFGSSRGVTVDFFFFLHPCQIQNLRCRRTLILQEHWEQKNLTFMKETAKCRDRLSSKFIFTDRIAVVSYIRKKNEIVLVISTQLLDDSLCNESHKKPNMILE